MLDKINVELKEAMKNKDKVKVTTLRMIIAAIKNKELEQKEKLEESDIIAVLKNSAKQRKDSIEQFTKGNREDLAVKEEAELKILENYLPKQLPESEVDKLVKEKMAELNLEFKKDMGQLMKAVMSEHKDVVDGKMLKNIVLKNLK